MAIQIVLAKQAFAQKMYTSMRSESEPRAAAEDAVFNQDSSPLTM